MVFMDFLNALKYHKYQKWLEKKVDDEYVQDLKTDDDPRARKLMEHYREGDELWDYDNPDGDEVGVAIVRSGKVVYAVER